VSKKEAENLLAKAKKRVPLKKEGSRTILPPNVGLSLGGWRKSKIKSPSAERI